MAAFGLVVTSDRSAEGAEKCPLHRVLHPLGQHHDSPAVMATIRRAYVLPCQAVATSQQRPLLELQWHTVCIAESGKYASIPQ
jgi:hypothetical protein